MIALWMAYSLLVSLALAIAASVLDRATSGALRQRRWIWVLALRRCNLIVRDSLAPASR